MTLPPIQIKALYLRYELGMTKGQVKALLTIPRSQVNTHLCVGKTTWKAYKRANLEAVLSLCSPLDADAYSAGLHL